MGLPLARGIDYPYMGTGGPHMIPRHAGLDFSLPLPRKDDPAGGLTAVDLSDLPEWNLGDLYSGPDSAAFVADFASAETAVAALECHRGKVAALDGAAFGNAIAAYEKVSELLGKIGSYAQLFLQENMDDPVRGRFYQDTVERLTDLGGRLLFFTLEINRLDEKVLAAKMAHPDAARYAPWVRDLRVSREHDLSDDLERLFLEKSTTGRTAWVRLFDETLAAMRCAVGSESLTLTEALNRLSDPQPERRKTAAHGIGAALGDKSRLFTLITNTLAKDKAIEDDWRKFPRPVSSRNLANLVEDEVVDALVAAVKGSYAETAHRYYQMKAKWLGKDQLDTWDRNAPLPQGDHRKIPWTEARRIVTDAYGGFSPGLAEIVERFFERRWIDAPARPGKASGAFS
ncbi:MAG: oligoendopeptidase F, partial [Rhodospirillaceae bacterium]